MPTADENLTGAQTALLLGHSERQLRRYRRAGLIEYQADGNRITYTPAAIARFRQDYPPGSLPLLDPDDAIRRRARRQAAAASTTQGGAA